MTRAIAISAVLIAAFVALLYARFAGDTVPKPSPSPAQEFDLVEPRGDLVNPDPQRWDSVDVVSEQELLVHFLGGVEECFGIHHVDVSYGRSTVAVTLYHGFVAIDSASAEDTVATGCILPGIFQAIKVPLAEPLSGRTIIDGAPPAQ